jgi:HK97 family phage prohead protease
MKRAYGLLEMKNFDDEKRLVEGMATTPSPDRYGDIVEPKGAVFKLPIPLLWQHMSSLPVGEVYAAKATAEGIEVKARVFKATESESLIKRLDEVWESLKLKLVKGFSIGFTPLESAQIKDTYSYRFLEWEWLELSLVTIPANAEATISAVKSASDAARNPRGVVRLDPITVRRARQTHRPGVVYLDRRS